MTISVEVCPGRKKERIALYCTWHQIRTMGEKSSETAIEDDGKGRGKKPKTYLNQNGTIGAYCNRACSAEVEQRTIMC
jgi:hypothetical protein